MEDSLDLFCIHKGSRFTDMKGERLLGMMTCQIFNGELQLKSPTENV